MVILEEIPYVAAQFQGDFEVQDIVGGDDVFTVWPSDLLRKDVAVKIGRDLFHFSNLPLGW